MFYYVYILQSQQDGRLYAGYSANLKQRIRTHINKGVYSTKRMGKIELVFYEAFKAEKDARRREKYFKTTKGKRALKIMLKESILGPIV